MDLQLFRVLFFCISCKATLPHPTHRPHCRAADADAASLQLRIDTLLEACTLQVFCYVRQGLFDRDKLTVLTMLALQIQLKVRDCPPVFCILLTLSNAWSTYTC